MISGGENPAWLTEFYMACFHFAIRDFTCIVLNMKTKVIAFRDWDTHSWLIHVVEGNKGVCSMLIILLVKGFQSSLVGILPYGDWHGSPLYN